MAAVLCNGIGACCNGLCTILALPFKLCGECCKVVGDACGGCCRGLSTACTFVFCQSPFTPYVILTLALQIGPIIWSLLTVVDPPGEDCGFVQVWMYVFGLLSVGHLLGAFYIAFRMAENLEDSTPPPQQQNTSNENNATSSTTQPQSGSSPDRGKYIWEYVQDLFTTTSDNNNNSPPPPAPSQNAHRGGSNSWKRFGHLMCYDPGVALYMILFLVWLIWLFMGVSARASADDNDKDDCERIADYAQNCIICGFIYAVMAAWSFCCSMAFLKV